MIPSALRNATSNYATLLGDVGGTNARFVIKQGSVLSEPSTLSCHEYPSLEAAIASYLASVGLHRVDKAAIALAGPVHKGQVTLTNLGWQVTAENIAANCGMAHSEHVSLHNDFEALALALAHIPSSELTWLGDIKQLGAGNLAVIGPGTGLGAAGLVRQNGRAIPVVGEGGHMSVSPASEREWQILRHIQGQGYPHISWERIVSGSGLPLLHEAVCQVDALEYQPLSAQQIGELAKAGTDKACIATINTFSALLGSFAGDIALSFGAIGGVFIAGGIIGKLGAAFKTQEFRNRFTAKGRFEGYLTSIGICAIESAYPAFYGLAAMSDN